MPIAGERQDGALVVTFTGEDLKALEELKDFFYYQDALEVVKSGITSLQQAKAVVEKKAKKRSEPL